MCSRLPPETAVQNRPNTVASTGTHLMTGHALTESIGTGIASFRLSVIASYQYPRDRCNQDQFHFVHLSDRSVLLRPVNMVTPISLPGSGTH